MLKKKWHCKTVTAFPSAATTGVQLKYQYLGNFLIALENMQRSAPWGIVYGKGGSSGS